MQQMLLKKYLNQRLSKMEDNSQIDISKVGKDVKRVGSELVEFSKSVSDAIQKINNNANQVVTVVGSVKDIADFYTQCQMINSKNRQLEAMTQVMLANTVAKFKLSEQFLTLSFGERHEALQHYYDIMDKAIAEDNQDLIIAAMNRISSIVTSSPLSDLEKFLRRFNDPSDSLLDF